MKEVRVSLPRPCSESWDAMQPAGCNRFCATCSETIHDLSQLTSREAEALLRAPGKHCMRAEVKPDGAVVVKPSPSGRSKRMLVAVGASVGLLTAACQTAPQTAGPTGRIYGKMPRDNYATSVTAIDENGRRYRALVQVNGSYRFKPLPYGAYTLEFGGVCERLEDEMVVLQESRLAVGQPRRKPSPGPGEVICITVGMATILDDHG